MEAGLFLANFSTVLFFSAPKSKKRGGFVILLKKNLKKASTFFTKVLAI